MVTKKEIVRQILSEKKNRPGSSASAFAPVNIALCKYWGKRDEELNLPITSSLSLALAPLGTQTHLAPARDHDQIFLNGQSVERSLPFHQRLIDFINLFRCHEQEYFLIRTENNIPTAAGLASSASGFAALIRALDRYYHWSLTDQQLSILARLGSGSACRSLYAGFVEWQAGERPDGMDSFAVPLPCSWPDLCLGVLTLSTTEKSISSRAAMKITRDTSILYRAWPQQVDADMIRLKQAIRHQDFQLLGMTAEQNSLAMHATMLSAFPPVCYWQPKTLIALQKIWSMRASGIPVYLTMDAGPNIKLLFLTQDRAAIEAEFDLRVIRPFDV